MMDEDWERIRAGFLRTLEPRSAGFTADEIDKILAESAATERPWHERTPWSYLFGGAVGAVFAIAVAGLTKWLGWT